MPYSLAQLEPLVAQVRAAVARVKSVIAGIGDDDTRKTQQTAVGTLERAVEAWATGQRDEVIAGKRTFDRWRSYAESDLLPMASRFAEGAGEFATQFAKLANTLGNGAQAIVDVFNSIVAKVDKLNADVEGLKKRRALFTKQQAAFKNAAISAEAKDLLYGDGAKSALSNYDRLLTLASGLNTAVSLVRNGRAKLQSDGTGDVRVVAATQLGAMTLGAAPIVAGLGAGAVVATVAIASSIALSLWTFFNHLNEVTAAETKRLELEAVKNPATRDAVLALKKLQNDADATKADDGFAGLFKVLKVLGTLAAVGGTVYVGKQIFEMVRSTRRTA